MKDQQRTIAIIAAVILGILAVLYIGGLAGQLGAGYQDWLGQDGMSGNAMIQGPDFNPFTCIPYSLSRNGIATTGFVILIGIAIFANEKGTCSVVGFT